MSSNLKAAIDIGSNSIKLRVGRWEDGQVSVLLDTTEVVRLGRGFKGEDGPRILDETMENAVRVVTEMTARARAMGAEIRMVGTMALRRFFIFQGGSGEDYGRTVEGLSRKESVAREEGTHHGDAEGLP